MKNRLAAAVLSLFVGGYLVIQGGFLAAAAMVAVQQEPPLVSFEYLSNEVVPQQQAFIRNRQDALAFYPLTTWRREMANAEMIMGLYGDDPDSLRESGAQTKRVLQMTPASPRDWLHLATLQMVLDLPVEGVIRYFSTALETGGDLPRLRDNMASMGMVLWPNLPLNTRNQVIDLIRNVWRYGRPPQKRALLQEAREQGLLPIVLLALAGEVHLQRYLSSL